jgi:hypothetical protein
MAITLADSVGRPLNAGDLVVYHGACWGEHGMWEVHGPCAGCPACYARWQQGEPMRMRLVPAGDGWTDLECVAPASVTLAGWPVPERDGVSVLGQARNGDVLDVPWMWPHRITVTGITPAGGVRVRLEWTAPGGVSGVLESAGGAAAALAAERAETGRAGGMDLEASTGGMRPLRMPPHQAPAEQGGGTRGG